MRIFELRTYHLKSAEAAAAYLPRWRSHIGSLKTFGVETHGFFAVPTDPKAVIALISFAEGTDTEAVTRAYMASDAFAADMQGFDRSQMDYVKTVILTPGDGSPLA